MFVADVLEQLSTGSTRLNEHATQYILNSVGGTHMHDVKRFIKPAQFAISKDPLHLTCMGAWRKHSILFRLMYSDTPKPPWALS